jgi:hypothetical protein
MTVRNRTVRGTVASEHVVQFFDTDESRATNVAAFLAEGYEAGEPIIIIARARNSAAILTAMESLGVPVQQAVEAGVLFVKEAVDTLRALSRSGAPATDLFEKVIGRELVALARHGRRIRAYGEMVDILAQRGDLPDAVALEALWNDLGTRVSCTLLCGYCAAHFVSTGTHRALLEICAAHSDVHRHEQDPLAGWLLSAAHTSAFVSPTLH